MVNLMDCRSKFVYSARLKTKSAEEVSAFFKKVIQSEGPPKILHTDNGKAFINSKTNEIAEKYQIRHVRGCPRMQGQIERLNQTIFRGLFKSMHEKELGDRWIDIHQDVVEAYNVTWRRSTNKSPMQVFRGR
jgi:transposase InsO family protein